MIVHFFKVTTDALCIDDPAHDLVIGKIEGYKFPNITHFLSGVVKNKQSRKDRRKNRKVKVADKFIMQNRQELCMKQASDVKLREIRRRVESGSVTKSRSFSSGETKFIRRNGLIYRHVKKNAKVSHQLVVPFSLTHSVISLAHESGKVVKVSNGAKIRNRYNQVPHLTQDTNGKVTNSQKTPQTRAKRSALSQQVTTKHI